MSLDKRIKELDNKYLGLIKYEDFRDLDDESKVRFQYIMSKIDRIRSNKGKPPMSKNQYLVLNLDDEIAVQQLCNRICVIADDAFMKKQTVKVKDIAVDLVNAILKAKEIS